MRIVSGFLKGKKINFLKSTTTRPLRDFVKENIFNIINHSNLVNVKLEIVNVTPFVLLLNIVNRPPPDIVNDACPVPVMVRLRVTAGRSAVNTIELIDPENSIVSSLALAFANIIAAWRELVTLPPSAEVTVKVVADAIAP